ncbi:hypothetical protein A3E49_03880 [Candidatus Saccharibacteria bacterium RIFCSPHIGHO2_12_FULL_49_19]|nr:MAG: hypothetical protein A3E49_03880 [Candidatus Saccharibacteria bacterium RIFCSPHIGHO2_12_FULL_49_19]OGL37667.1 MAG: hypothetical protein A3B63_03045 [Candidatus Saccharibacteria bacterium RIFCSPLOWO2_01_FULL_49_22]
MEKEPERISESQRPTSGEDLSPDSLGVTEYLFSRANHLRQRHFTRPVTVFKSKDGEEYRASADQVDIDAEDPSNVRVRLKTHDVVIAMTIAGLLTASGLIYLQRNRSQRKKMSKRDSSFLRKPRK